MLKRDHLKAISLGIFLAVSAPVLAGTSQSVHAAVNDTWITTQIKSNLASNPVTNATAISVETNNGIVSLVGTAQSDTEAATAVQIAEATKGVRDVDTSNLNVNDSNQPLTDTYITAKVKGAFVKDNLLGSGASVPLKNVTVETQQGVVYLSGTATHQSQIDKAITIAKTIDGVTDVVSTVQIS